MSLRDRLIGSPADRAEYQAARADQTAIQHRQEADGTTEETPEYQAANARTRDAAKRLPWLGR